MKRSVSIVAAPLVVSTLACGTLPQVPPTKAPAPTVDGGMPDSSADADWKRAHDAFLAALDAGVPDIDVEGDGRTHLLRTFRGADVLTSTWKVDGVVYARDDYSTATIKHELYADDGSLELLVEETPTSSGRGPISIRKTHFLGDSGTPYTRESYQWDGESATIVITNEEDASHTGEWIELSTHEEQASDRRVVLAFSGKAPACESRLAAAVEAAERDGTKCLGAMSKSLKARLQNALYGTQTVTIRCGGAGNACGLHDPDGTVTIYDAALTPDCGSLESTIFHEMLHLSSMLGRHPSDPTQAAGDRVVGCAAACFEELGHRATSLDCAQCLGAKNGDSRCAKYPFEACPKAFYCSCDGHRYDQEAACVSNCNASLACFTNICGPAATSGPCR